MKKWIFLGLTLVMTTGMMGQSTMLSVAETQTTLVTKRTATWCTICGGFAWDMMKRLQTDFDSSQAVVLNAHHSSGSRLYSTVAETWIDAFESSFSQPRFYAGTEVLGSGSSDTENAIRERIGTDNSSRPVAQSAMAVSFEPETRSLRVQARMTFFQDGEAGNYRLGLYLVERRVMEEQANRGSNAEHRNVLREAITDNPFGAVLHQGAYTTGQSYDVEEFFVLSEDYDIDNLMFLSVIWEGGDESPSYVNATATTKYERMQTTSLRTQSLPGTFRLLANPVREELTLNLTLPGAEAALHWQLSGVQGQTWKQGQFSFLPAGTHTLTIPVPELQPGLFFLQLRNEKGEQSTFPFVKR